MPVDMNIVKDKESNEESESPKTRLMLVWVIEIAALLAVGGGSALNFSYVSELDKGVMHDLGVVFTVLMSVLALWAVLGGGGLLSRIRKK
jgi:hypothetical protein